MSDSDAELDRLLAEAKRHDHPPAATTDRAWASLEAAMSVGAAPSVPIDVTAAAGGGLGVKGLVIVAVAIVTATMTAIVAGALEGRDRGAVPQLSDREPQLRTPVATPSPAIPPAVLEPPLQATLPAGANDVPPDATPRPHASAVATPSGASDGTPRPVVAVDPEPTASDASASTLAEQARLLGEAWRALNENDSARALALVQDHAERFPKSPLAPEREACRIVAWCTEGRPWARERARRFLAAHDGTVADRVARACPDAAREDP